MVKRFSIKLRLAEFLAQIKQELQQQRHVVIVHGGGPQVEQLMQYSKYGNCKNKRTKSNTR